MAIGQIFYTFIINFLSTCSMNRERNDKISNYYQGFMLSLQISEFLFCVYLGSIIGVCKCLKWLCPLSLVTFLGALKSTLCTMGITTPDLLFGVNMVYFFHTFLATYLCLELNNLFLVSIIHLNFAFLKKLNWQHLTSSCYIQII